MLCKETKEAKAKLLLFPSLSTIKVRKDIAPIWHFHLEGTLLDSQHKEHMFLVDHILLFDSSPIQPHTLLMGNSALITAVGKLLSGVSHANCPVA